MDRLAIADARLRGCSDAVSLVGCASEVALDPQALGELVGGLGAVQSIAGVARND